MPNISRRNFLQGVGASAVVGSLSGLIPGTAQAMNSVGANPVLLNKRAGTLVEEDRIGTDGVHGLRCTRNQAGQ